MYMLNIVFIENKTILFLFLENSDRIYLYPMGKLSFNIYITKGVLNGTKPVDNVTQIIGNTPVVKLRNVVDEDARYLCKIRISKPGRFSKRPYCTSND